MTADEIERYCRLRRTCDGCPFNIGRSGQLCARFVDEKFLKNGYPERAVPPECRQVRLDFGEKGK